jgi:hypothetical protein
LNSVDGTVAQAHHVLVRPGHGFAIAPTDAPAN